MSSYEKLKAFFEENSIEYLPCEATTFVLARLAPNAQTRDDERAAVTFYREAGVLFFTAADYRMPPGFRGWMRVSFAIEPERFRIAMERLKTAHQRYLTS